MDDRATLSKLGPRRVLFQQLDSRHTIGRDSLFFSLSLSICQFICVMMSEYDWVTKYVANRL